MSDWEGWRTHVIEQVARSAELAKEEVPVLISVQHEHELTPEQIADLVTTGQGVGSLTWFNGNENFQVEVTSPLARVWTVDHPDARVRVQVQIGVSRSPAVIDSSPGTGTLVYMGSARPGWRNLHLPANQALLDAIDVSDFQCWLSALEAEYQDSLPAPEGGYVKVTKQLGRDPVTGRAVLDPEPPAMLPVSPKALDEALAELVTAMSQNPERVAGFARRVVALRTQVAAQRDVMNAVEGRLEAAEALLRRF